MSTPSIPSIPPRPVRSQKEQASNPPTKDIPQIPPRPARRMDRSQSPQRENFARSPLNETSFPPSRGNDSGTLHASNRNLSSSNLPQRPPSVTLPSIGKEGDEYANFDEGAPPSSPTETRNVGSDVQLHAPKPGLPTSSAKARVATVTRTDSSQANAAVLGRSQDDKEDPLSRPLHSKVSFTSQDSSSMERVGSTLPGENEQGIPEIGQRVPMYPNAGDVQAPSPSPFGQSLFPGGIGYHNDGQHRPGGHHGRTRSGKEHIQGPPGSYGLHGHGIPVQDKLERAWYERHPEALVREEHGEYGPGIGGGRGEWALSSEDLNKIVRATASRGSDVGISSTLLGTPDEQIGYIASEEFASRLNSPHLQSTIYHQKSHSNHSQPHLDSPLRKMSFPAEDLDKDRLDLSLKAARSHGAQSTDSMLESEAEDDVIHVDAPSRRASRAGGAGYEPGSEELGPQNGNLDERGVWLNEHGYRVPILAPDEVAKGETGEFMQPAVSPHQEVRGNNYFTTADGEQISSYSSGQGRSGSRGSSMAGSQPPSRPGSIVGGVSNLARFASQDDREQVGTPLEDVEEYEPLFPENEKDNGQTVSKERPMTAADRLKRPDLAKHRFPSQDVWEDAPSSAQLQATVSTPDLGEDETETVIGEDVDAQHSNDDTGTKPIKATVGSHEASFDLAKPHFKPHLRDELGSRPGMKQRFPSRDIWEDTPASLQLQTTVSNPQMDEISSPADAPESAGAREKRSPLAKTGGGSPLGHDDGKSSTNPGGTLDKAAKPTLPARPLRNKAAQSPTESANQHQIPARPPQRLRQVPPAEIPPPPEQASALKSPPSRNVPPPWVPSNKADDGVTEPRSPEKGPTLPERPKPQVPARPAKPLKRGSSEGAPLTKVGSAASATSVGSGPEEAGSSKGTTLPPAPKPKPAVPARPNGGKLSNLKAGFLSDLDKRLQIGPKASKPADKSGEEADEELEKEKIPLSDARKGRARGPARRKKATSPSAVPEEVPTEQQVSKLELVPPNMIWQIGDDGQVNVPSVSSGVSQSSSPSTKAAHSSTPTLATNTAGEPLHEEHEVASGATRASHPQDQDLDLNQQKEETARKLDLASRLSDTGEAVEEIPMASDDPPITGHGLEGSKVRNMETAEQRVEKDDPTSSPTKPASTLSTEVPAPLSDLTAEESNNSPLSSRPKAELASSAVGSNLNTINSPASNKPHSSELDSVLANPPGGASSLLTTEAEEERAH
ncbi:MAG: hypothetical protein M1837_006608 [Sclerophora amabilis]|nr:MAG: hypothetical protein M1837_006608 [Sclerophora amabilis]